MKRYLSVVLFGLVSASATLAQPNLVKVRVRVILVDQELSQKPVPFFLVSLKSGAKAAEVKTILAGTAETQLPPGRCTVSSPKPAELGGRRFSWNIQVSLSGAEQNIDLTNDNAKVEEIAAPASPAKAATNDLTEQFKRLRNSVVTVRSESGHGTGFFVDGKGLILTNQHVVGNSEYLAVQFDRTHKIAAKLIAADPQKDVALLSVNMATLPNASPAPLYRPRAGRTPVQEESRKSHWHAAARCAPSGRASDAISDQRTQGSVADGKVRSAPLLFPRRRFQYRAFHTSPGLPGAGGEAAAGQARA